MQRIVAIRLPGSRIDFAIPIAAKSEEQKEQISMTTNRTDVHLSLSLLAGLILTVTSCAKTAGDPPDARANSAKLKIVFLMGQSNMVGYSSPRTAWYLTQPMYVPPPKTALAKSRYYDGGYFYWQGVSFASGSEEFNARGKAVLAERKASRARWRALVYGNFSRNPTRNDWRPEYGPAPKTGTKYMYPFLNKKAEEEGIYKRMVEHIESPENKLHPRVALEQLSKRDAAIADGIKRVREIFLKGTKPEDFDRLAEALKAKGRDYAKDRAAYAELVREHVNLPIAERTRITAFGEVAGEETEFDYSRTTQGVLSVGYAKHATNSGPEYAFGISFERLVDGPVLIVKCAWGGTSVHSNWRPPSLSNAETPIEKATREAANRAGAEDAKKGGFEFKPKQPQTGTGKCWERAMAHIQKVLADPGKYHPDYDPNEGYELAGLVWFQGWNDMGNKAYGEQLVTFIKDFRKELDAPSLPVVCGLVGHSAWKQTTFDGNVNSGMLHAARDADLKGTVDIVNTVKYFPLELGLKGSVKAAYGAESDEYRKAEQIINRSCSNSGLHYFGSAKFLCLTGNAMARSLANLATGGEPAIHEEAEALVEGGR
ncbi:MAG: sialate O-acetylesterase [Planctomycetota bacterium]